MNNKNFLSIDNWKNALMNLPENNFFELLRSFFGNIKTPFNKQGLLNDLSSMLSRDITQEKIKSYIDKTDHKIIAAIALLNNPAIEELESFFEGEYEKYDLQGLLVNLEERLIIYRSIDNKTTKMALNPILETVLIPYIEDLTVLFPYSINPKNNSNFPLFIYEGRQIAALLSFFLLQEDPFKTGEAKGGFRKKILDDGEKLFPGMDIELSLKAMIKLDLVFTDGNKLISNRDAVDNFGKLSMEDALTYWTSAVYLYREEETRQDEFDIPSLRSIRNRRRQIAQLLKKLKAYLLPEIVYPDNTIRRLIKLAEMEEKNPWPSHLFEDSLGINYNILLEALSKTGYLHLKDTEQKSEVPNSDPVIVMDTAFSFILYPEISFSDALKLAEFCDINDSPVSLPAFSFVLTRESVVRGFDLGINSKEMHDLLISLSNNRTDSNLGWTLNEWEKRYEEVSLTRGLILILSEERLYLAEAEPLSSLIIKSLAPGVYLLSTDEANALNAIRRTGVDIIAQPRYERTEKKEAVRQSYTNFSSLSVSQSKTDIQDLVKINNKNDEKNSENTGKALKEKYHKILNTMELTKTEKDELSSRIERRLVLNEKQLDKSSVRYEKLEARGLDFAGKSSIAKQAVESKSLVDISWPGGRGETNSCTGIAEALEKKGNESILVVKTEEDTVRVPLGKISLIKRIKQSIFIRS